METCEYCGAHFWCIALHLAMCPRITERMGPLDPESVRLVNSIEEALKRQAKALPL